MKTSLVSLRAFLRRFVVALVLVFVLASAGIGGTYWYFNDKFDDIAIADISDPKVLNEEAKGDPANFLIIGSDTRSFVNDPIDVQQYGDPTEQTGQRSDSIMIAQVDPDHETGLLVSFPRDLWVDIACTGKKSRINAAFNYGPQCVIETLKQNFDIPIHHYLEVNFEGFKNIVEAIGGVHIWFPTAARDEKTGLAIPKGPRCYDLNGGDALAYVRSRYYEYLDAESGRWRSDPTSDFGRIRRQQYFMRSLAQEAIDRAIRHPFSVNNIVNKTFANLVKDKNLALSDVKALAKTFREVDPAVVEMITIPTTGATIGGASVQLLREEEAAEIFQRLRAIEVQPGPDIPEGVDPADVAVKVLNGSGASGQARVTSQALEALGFRSGGSPADADRRDYETTEVRYAPGGETKARYVLAYLGGVGKVVAVDAGDVPAGADVVLVLGRDFEAVTSPTTSPPSSSNTTAAPTTTTVPPNPGGPGQPAVGCG